MALLVETGAGLATANSYFGLHEATLYHADRGNSSWLEANSAQHMAALIKATDYLTASFGQRWLGRRAHETQALDWPRRGVVVRHGDGAWQSLASNLVPEAVKAATAELALLALKKDLLKPLPRGGQVKRVRVAGAVEQEFFEGAPATTDYPAVSGLLSVYLAQPSRRLLRA